MDELTSKAIGAALNNDWAKAVELNLKILKSGDQNIDCLNRLGKAYLELGDHKRACQIIRKALKIDKYDSIAQKNLARATQDPCKKVCSDTSTSKHISFLEEPGKTKLISLVNLAPANELLKQKQADAVILTLKRHTVIATDTQKTYLGSLPDDIGHRLSVLIKGGNTYCAFIKSVCKNSLVIFVKETFRTKKFADTPSFITNASDYFSYVREELVSDKPVVDAEGEDESSSISEKIHSDEEPEAN